MQLLIKGELNNTQFDIVMTAPGRQQSVYMVARPTIFFCAPATNLTRRIRKSNLLYPFQRSAGVAVNAKCLIMSGNGLNNSMAGKTQKYSVKRDHWKDLPDLNVGRYSHGICSFKLRYCLVFAGYSFTNADDDNPIEILDTYKTSQGWQILQLNSMRRLP